jgi:hypothetical protein
MTPAKAGDEDFLGRYREIISDPLNLLIERVPMAGVVEADEVYLHNGNRVPVSGPDAYYGLYSQVMILNRGVHEPLEEYVFQEVLKSLGDAPVMLELGAYWGHYSMWLKKVKPRSTVILVEPDPTHLATGINNFKRNNLVGEFVQSFVGRDALHVDAFRASRKLERLAILHVDIQGYEIEMLDGCAGTLAEWRVDYLFVSTHSQTRHDEVAKALTLYGYRIEVASDIDNDATSFDGLIFASSPQAAKIFERFNPLGRTKIIASHPKDVLKALAEIRLCAESKHGA